MKTTIAPREETKQGALAPRRELHPFSSLQHEMNRFFEDLKTNWGFSHPTLMETMGDFHTKVDMKDNDKEIVVSAEMPGVDLKDIEISLKSNVLVLKGEKRMEKEEKEKGYYRMERSYGSLYRAIPLPCEIDKDEVDAVYKDGVLTVTLPKTKEALKTEKQINVKAG